MKSPSNSVGIMESEGMRNGSNRNERITSTSTMTGKNERAYSTAIGSRTRSGGVPAAAAARLRRRAKKAWSRPQMAPEMAPTTHQHEAEVHRLVAKQAPQHRQREHHEGVAGEPRQQRLVDAGRARVALRPQEPAVDQDHQHAGNGRAQKTYE